MIVGLLGKTPGVEPEKNSKYSVRIVPPVLRAMGVDHLCLESDKDIPDMVRHINEAYERSRPLVVLLGSRIAP
jgi:hypothetical protein